MIVGALVGVLALTFLPQMILGNKGGEKRPPMQQAMQALGNADITTMANLTHSTPDAVKSKLTSKGFTVTSDNQTLNQIAGSDREK